MCGVVCIWHVMWTLYPTHCGVNHISGLHTQFMGTLAEKRKSVLSLVPQLPVCFRKGAPSSGWPAHGPFPSLPSLPWNRTCILWSTDAFTFSNANSRLIKFWFPQMLALQLPGWESGIWASGEVIKWPELFRVAFVKQEIKIVGLLLLLVNDPLERSNGIFKVYACFSLLASPEQGRPKGATDSQKPSQKRAWRMWPTNHHARTQETGRKIGSSRSALATQ